MECVPRHTGRSVPELLFVPWHTLCFYTSRNIMKKIILFIMAALFPLIAGAQVKFAHFSYEAVYTSMPGHAIVKENMKKLASQYDAETKRAEEEFNLKYEEFLEGQRTFAPAILNKRQAELQEIMSRNIAFKEEARRLLKQAEEDLKMPLKAKINDALKRIGAERGYAFIINTDNNACPYINPAMGTDITAELKELLKKE